MNYEKDIRIDETALDVEWLQQPRLMMQYAQYAVEARMKLDQSKESLDIVRAQLDKEVRTDPKSFGIEKITEAVVDNTIIIQDVYKQANEELRQAKYEADMAQNAVRAVEQRKDALENLVKLHGQQYFAGPKVPRDLSYEAKKKAEQAQLNDTVGAAIRRKK